MRWWDWSVRPRLPGRLRLSYPGGMDIMARTTVLEHLLPSAVQQANA